MGVMKTNKKCHYFISTTGQTFYAIKVLGSWRFVGKKTGIIREMNSIAELKKYIKNVFGFYYLGYL